VPTAETQSSTDCSDGWTIRSGGRRLLRLGRLRRRGSRPSSPSANQLGETDARAVRLASELDDVREAVALLKDEFRGTIEPLVADRRLLGDLADSVRKCATLVALADGQGTVELRHELVALL
jgi:hypothetical protein